MNDTTARIPQPALTLFLGVGPVVSSYLISVGAGGKYLPDSAYPYVAFAILLIWSPLPFSLPAVALGEVRDMHRILNGGGMWSLFSHLSSRKNSSRAAFLSSLVGFVAAIVVAITLS